MGFVVFCHHQTAARFFVETMNDSRALFAAYSGKGLAMIEQRVNQRVLTMTSSRMNDHSGGLVDYDEIRVFEKNIKRDLLRLIIDLFQWWLDQLDLVISANEIARTGRLPIESDGAGANQLLNP